MTTKKLSRWQAHLIKFLLGFYFIISYILDKINRKIDLLTRQSNDSPANDQDD